MIYWHLVLPFHTSSLLYKYFFPCFFEGSKGLSFETPLAWYSVHELDFQPFLTFAKCSIEKQPSEVFCKKGCSKKFRKIHRKTPVPESLFYEKETLVQVFSSEFYEIFKNTFFNRTPLVAAFVHINLTRF